MTRTIAIPVGGVPLHPDPAAAHEAGVATIHQESHLVPFMTVAENIMLGRWPTRFGFVSRAAQLERARAVLAKVAPGLPPGKLARRLSPAEQQLVEIARAVAEDSRVLIMDEPTTSLSGPEIDQLFAVVRNLRAKGLGIVFVSHWLEEVFAIADRVTVLRDGRFVDSRPAATLDADKVVTMMVGRHVEEVRAVARPLGPPVLEVRNLTRLGVIDDIIPEPQGGAHRDHGKAATMLGDSIQKNLEALLEKQAPALIKDRIARFRVMGSSTIVSAPLEN